MTTKKTSKGIAAKSAQAPVTPKNAKEQKKADKTVASGKMAIVKADRKAAAAEKKAVHTQIAKEKGYTHGVTIGLWNRGSEPSTGMTGTGASKKSPAAAEHIQQNKGKKK